MAKKFTEDQLNWILSVDSTEAQQGIRALTKTNRELEKANKERRQEMVKLEMQGKTETEAYKNLTAVIKHNDTQIKSNRAVMKGLESTIGLTSLTMSQLKKQAQDLQRQMDNTSKSLHPAEYDKLQTELVKVKNRMDELKNAGKKTEDSLGKTILSKGTVASFLGNMYTKAAEKLGEMVAKAKEFVTEGVQMAGMAQGVERAFNRISNPETLSELRAATKGTVNDLELMKAAVQANNFNIPLTELGTLLRFAQQRAQETGESVEYLTNSIVTGIGRKSPLILDNLGISAVKLNEEFAKSGDFAKAVGTIVREELAKSGESIDTAADKAQQRAALLQNIQMSIGQRMIGIVDSAGSAWTSFLDVINRWVNIPTVEKLRDEQRETNILARSIMAAEGRTEARNLLIKEMQRQYPSFLANLDTEKIANEQIAERLREVNKEYGNRIRNEVLNDKILSPLQEKQKTLIEEQMKGITELNEIAEKYPDKLSKGFIEAIHSGDILKMSSKDIQKELSVLQPKVIGLSALAGSVTTAITGNILAGQAVTRMVSKSTGLLTSDIESTIKRLGDIPSELDDINGKIETTTKQIINFGKDESTPDPKPAKDLLALEEEKLKTAKERVVINEKDLTLKNQEIAAIEKEITRLKELGIVKKQPKEKPTVSNNTDLKILDNVHAEELRSLAQFHQESEESEETYKSKIISSELAYYSKRIKDLEDFKSKSKDKGLQADIDKQVIEAGNKTLALQQQQAELTLSLLKKNRDKALLIDQESYKVQKTVIEKSLAENEITQEQYNALMLSLEASSSDTRLKLAEQYQTDVSALELTSGTLKADAIKEANTAVLDADLAAAKARSTQQKALQDLVTDFKGEFKLTTVDEETELQMKALEASYQARKEMAEKDKMDTSELDAAYERAKTNILQQEEDKRNQIRQQYGLLSMQDQYEMEMEQLKEQHAQGLIEEEDYEKAKVQIKGNYLKKSFDAYAGMFSGAITALQDAELANIDAKYDAEIQRAGDNSEEVARLEKEKENKKLAVQKKYAGVQFAIKVSEIIANTAVSITQAFAQLGPIGGAIAAAMLGATGVAQIAIANAERKKVMNMSVDGGPSSGGGGGAHVATGKQSGGYIDVVRAQDGKEFNAELDPDKRGFVDKPTVIVGEGPVGNSREWVASNAALENPTVVPFINVLNDAQEKGVIRTVDMNQMMRKRLAGFETGGSISPVVSPAAPNVKSPSESVIGSAQIEKLNALLSKLDRDGLKAYIIYSELQKEQIRLDESRKIGSKS